MDDIQAKAIFKLSTPDIKKSVRAFLTKNKNSQRSELTNSFSELYHDISLQLHAIDAAYKERCGQKVSRVTYKQVVALAWGMAPKCRGCGKPSLGCLPTSPGSGVFRTEYCSRKCLNTSEHAWAKRKATTTERYGTENYFASKDFSNRIPDILSEKYGMSVINPSQVPSIQAKKIKTSLRKRGVSHHMQDTKFRAKQAKSDMFTPASYNRMRVRALQEYADKTGYANPLSNPRVQAKVTATNMEKYGTANPANSEQVRRKIARSNASDNVQQTYQATSMRNNGTPYPNQASSVSRKAIGKRYSEVMCLGRPIKLEGCEPVVVNYLESLGTVKRIYSASSFNIKIPYVDGSGKSRFYHPDLAMVGNSGTKYLVECKVPRTLWADGFMGENTLRKLKALEGYCASKGYVPLLVQVNRQNSLEFRSVEVIKNPVAWMQKSIRQKLKHALSSSPELVPSL